jgi:hypothetical protein
MSLTKDWRKICTDCQEGEPPEDCEFYGEPNGCNSPTYGEHPTCKESLQVGNAAKMRDALTYIRHLLYHIDSEDSPHKSEAIALACNVLSAPPRNIDNIKDYGEMVEAWNAYVKREHGDVAGFFDWLFAEAKGEQK